MPASPSDPPEPAGKATRDHGTYSARHTADAILVLLLEGKSRNEICTALGLARDTVDHVCRVLILDAGCTTAAELTNRIWAARCAELQQRLEARESLRHDRRSSDRRRTDQAGDLA